MVIYMYLFFLLENVIMFVFDIEGVRFFDSVVKLVFVVVGNLVVFSKLWYIVIWKIVVCDYFCLNNIDF